MTVAIISLERQRSTRRDVMHFGQFGSESGVKYGGQYSSKANSTSIGPSLGPGPNP